MPARSTERRNNLMDSREILISELGFLDESIVAFDENPKKSIGEKSALNQEVSSTTSENILLKSVEGLSDDAALAVLESYKKIPKAVKDSVGNFYDTLQRLGGDTTMQDVKDSLKGLKEACSDGYERVYKSAVKDAKKIVPKIQTRLMMEGIEEEKGK